METKTPETTTSTLGLDTNDSELEALLSQTKTKLAAKEKEKADEDRSDRSNASKLQALSVPLRLSSCENNHMLPLQVNPETGVATLDTRKIYAKSEDSELVTGSTSQSSLPPAIERKIGQNDPTVKRKTRGEIAGEKEMTAGKRWFGMKAPVMTQELKNDLRVLQLRNVLDPKQFYKKGTVGKEAPKYFEMGTIIEGPTEFYSSRLTKKERRGNLVDELLADKQTRDYFKRKVSEIHTQNKSGNSKWYRENRVGGKKRQKFSKTSKRK
ncbi:rrna-processing protein fcf2 [Coemansia sp. RSA 1813]|nr:dTDP-fucopyranose mutase [Coemansia sp. RSA 1646]KAJ1768694.1 rrna-processing protein fcf2 [Coemansia sp. RSA 1843]KAJ2093623.1 rrna-processing protein fcf2 [Coemansia sp. RSA 986]KAJ2214992.1 rrna-processing protein fcf2 [Coemansia sp. RSA 487]KAJ2565741.1 rrna-processing protein fcf2 [Coemansia sp. RSA 1813]